MLSSLKGLRSIFLILMYLLSSTGPGAFIAYPAIETTIMLENDKQIAKETVEQNRLAEEERLRLEAEAEHKRLYTPLNFERTDIDNYAVLYLPESHFTLSDTNNSKSSLNFNYLDAFSSLNISYKSKVDTEESLNSIIGMEENIQEQRVENSNLNMFRYEAEAKENEMRHTCWIVKQADSILIADAIVYPETDYEAFKLALEAGLDKSNIYYVSDYVFSVPETGYYSQFIEYEVQDNNVNNNNESNVNNNSSTKQESYSGILDTDEISGDWKDMKVKLDGDIIELPCKLGDLLNLGYATNDSLEELSNSQISNEITDENGNVITEQIEYKFNSDFIKSIYLVKNNGVTIKVEVSNNTDNDINLEELDVKQLKISREEFGKFTSQSKYTEIYLPELIYVGGATWDISADGFLKILNTREVYKIEQAKGGFKIGTSNTEKEIEVITDGYSNISSIKMTIK